MCQQCFYRECDENCRLAINKYNSGVSSVEDMIIEVIKNCGNVYTNESGMVFVKLRNNEVHRFELKI